MTASSELLNVSERLLRDAKTMVEREDMMKTLLVIMCVLIALWVIAIVTE